MRPAPRKVVFVFFSLDFCCFEDTLNAFDMPKRETRQTSSKHWTEDVRWGARLYCWISTDSLQRPGCWFSFWPYMFIYREMYFVLVVQVGATLGVGMAEGKNLEEVKQAVNWKMFFEVFASWIATVIVSACLSAAIFSLLVYSPCLNQYAE